MKTGTVEFLPVTFLTDAELSRALASSPDELVREAAYRLAESADDLDQMRTDYASTLVDIDQMGTDYASTLVDIDQMRTDYASTLVDIDGSLTDAIGALVDVMSEIECDDQDMFIQLDRIRSDLETLSASVSAKEAAL